MEQLNPIEWAIRPVKMYADFSGRAPRAEYWWYGLGSTIISVIVAVVDWLTFGSVYGGEGPLGLLLAIALLVPGAAVTVRRLHDIDRNGWWFLLNVWSYVFLVSGSVQRSLGVLIERLPIGVGFVAVMAFVACLVVLLGFMITRGTEGPNRSGPDPYGPDELEEVFA